MAKPRTLLLGVSLFVGMLAVAASAFFAVAAAGIYGTPFQGTDRENLLLLTLLLGPIAILPCTLLGLARPG